MNNKRGIAQAFSNPSEGLGLRPATVFDVFGMSRTLTRSFCDLCQADHRDDPMKLALWTANKDPAAIRDWIDAGASLWVATKREEVVAVGGLRAEGEISLLYVDPDHSGQRIGATLLHQLQDELRAQGCTEAQLRATKTAHGFYVAQGWQDAGDPTEWNGLPQYPMRKSLHPVG
ncbi:GNAT family N-acetyltransferase [Ruegeria conchae]|uniref:Acetyltransferase (GNAT) family protein n=1 Tax=Ruegeria conchae TaxID=981384 RepID=A0A497Z174_9RHOB|nr:GNAT family N-acetyltransferase [Ruegeria conchae]RLK00693.1 acetyltransferase (GNAT) family protein [Ruegeria conchae]